MNQRFLSVAAFAVIVAGLASLLMYRLVVNRLQANAQANRVKLPVAARNLEQGSMIRESDLRFVDWPGPIPAQAIQKKEDITGRGVIANIYENEPVLETRLAARGAGAGLAALIPKGMRAVAVKVDEVVGVAGFVVPGMRVDVLISGTAPGEQRGDGSETRTILQNIEVLSAGQTFQRDGEGKPVTTQVVNLLVTPEQAETLSLASTQAHIQLVLRNPLDTAKAETPGRALSQLFGKPVAPPAPKTVAAPRPKPVEKPLPLKAEPPAVTVQVKVVEVLHGSKRTEAKFEKGPEVTR
jgi:pilus assembly protein CpaB